MIRGEEVRWREEGAARRVDGGDAGEKDGRATGGGFGFALVMMGGLR